MPRGPCPKYSSLKELDKPYLRLGALGLAKGGPGSPASVCLRPSFFSVVSGEGLEVLVEDKDEFLRDSQLDLLTFD